MPTKDSKTKKTTRCPAGSRRNADSGKCVEKTNVNTVKKEAPSKKSDTVKKEAPSKKSDTVKKEAPSKKSDTIKKAAPSKKSDTVKKAAPSKKKVKKSSSVLPKEVKDEIKKLETFYDVYEEEKSGLISNVRDGHKKGTLNKLFTSAKSALGGLLRLVRSPYFIMLICVALAYYTGMSPTAGKTMAVNAFNTLQQSSLGSYVASSAATIPSKYASAKAFVDATWRELWMYKGVGRLFNTMNDFMAQIGDLLQTSRSKLGIRWTTMLTGIQTVYGKIMENAKSYLPLVQRSLSSLYTKATSSTLGPVYTSRVPSSMTSIGSTVGSTVSSAATGIKSYLSAPSSFTKGKTLGWVAGSTLYGSMRGYDQGKRAALASQQAKSKGTKSKK